MNHRDYFKQECINSLGRGASPFTLWTYEDLKERQGTVTPHTDTITHRAALHSPVPAQWRSIN